MTHQGTTSHTDETAAARDGTSPELARLDAMLAAGLDDVEFVDDDYELPPPASPKIDPAVAQRLGLKGRKAR